MVQRFYMIDIIITRASRWRVIAYPRASAIAYFPACQNSKGVLPILIHRTITYDNFKVLAKKHKNSWVTIKKRTQNPTFWPLVTLRHALGQTFCTTVFSSSLPSIWYATCYVCTKWILTHRGQPLALALPPGVTSKFRMCSSSPHPGYYCDSFKVLAKKA